MCEAWDSVIREEVEKAVGQAVEQAVAVAERKSEEQLAKKDTEIARKDAEIAELRSRLITAGLMAP